MPPTCWLNPLGGVHQLRGEIDQVPPSGCVHPVPEVRELRHLVPQVCGVVGVKLLRQQGEVLLGKPQGLAQVLDDALHLVGGDGPGQYGVLRPEVAVDALDQLVPEPPGEVEVNVGERRHLLGDEALQGEVPLQGIDVADADQVSDQQGHRRAAPPSGRPLLHRRLRADQAALLHDALREEDDLPVEQQEARQVEALDQPKLLPETLVHPLRHPAAVAPRGRLVAEPPQVALGRVALRHGWVRQGVAEVGAEIEVAPLRDAEGVGDGLRTLPEEHLHLGMGLQVQMMVGLQVRQRLIYGRVEPGGDQRVLEAGALGTMVVDVVGGDHRDADFPGDSDQLPVAVGVAVQKVPMELDVDRAGTVPVQVPPQKVVGITWATAHRQFRETPVAPARQQDDTLGVVGQKARGRASAPCGRRRWRW